MSAANYADIRRSQHAVLYRLLYMRAIHPFPFRITIYTVVQKIVSARPSGAGRAELDRIIEVRPATRGTHFYRCNVEDFLRRIGKDRNATLLITG